MKIVTIRKFYHNFSRSNADNGCVNTHISHPNCARSSHTMRSFARQIFAILALSICCTPAMADVQWQTDLEAAKRTAAQTNKLVLLHFWAQWCKPCMRLENTVFNQPGVGEQLAKNFVPVKVNIDLRPTTARQFGVQSIPADVIITPDGKVIEKTSSPRTAAAYVGRMQQVAMKVPNRGLQAYANLPGAAATTGAAAATARAANPAASQPVTPSQAVTAPAGVYGQFPAQNTTQPLGQQLATRPTGVPNGAYGQNPAPTAPPAARATPNAFGGPPAFGTNPPPAISKPTGLPSGPAAFGHPAAQQQPPFTQPPVAQAPIVQPPVTQPPVAHAPAFQQPAFQQPNPPVASQTPTTGNFGAATTPPNFAQQPAPNTPQPQAQPTADPKWGMEAFCPVTLNQKKQWVPGDRRWGVEHQGRVYLFASEESKQKFFANPNYYAPVLAGHDPVLMIDQRTANQGRREHGVFYRDRVYMFSSEASLTTFSANPSRYADQVAALEAQAAASR
jgi:YHS domain-containing protein/thiol-disulfide isomerase/thioredoxin